MNLRRRFVLYLVAVHAMLAGLAWWLLQQNMLWLIALEVVFAVSLSVGVAIVTRLSASLAAVRQSAQMLHEGEFTTRFLEIHHVAPRNEGGTNRIENLTTLCSRCHRFTHEHRRA